MAIESAKEFETLPKEQRKGVLDSTYFEDFDLRYWVWQYSGILDVVELIQDNALSSDLIFEHSARRSDARVVGVAGWIADNIGETLGKILERNETQYAENSVTTGQPPNPDKVEAFGHLLDSGVDSVGSYLKSLGMRKDLAGKFIERLEVRRGKLQGLCWDVTQSDNAIKFEGVLKKERAFYIREEPYATIRNNDGECVVDSDRPFRSDVVVYREKRKPLVLEFEDRFARRDRDKLDQKGKAIRRAGLGFEIVTGDGYSMDWAMKIAGQAVIPDWAYEVVHEDEKGAVFPVFGPYVKRHANDWGARKKARFAKTRHGRYALLNKAKA